MERPGGLTGTDQISALQLILGALLAVGAAGLTLGAAAVASVIRVSPSAFTMSGLRPLAEANLTAHLALYWMS